jgi:hypothetical protein
MEQIGKPIEAVDVDNMEVERRFQLENENDLNYQLSAKNPNKNVFNGNLDPKNFQDPNDPNIPEENKVPYIKGEVRLIIKRIIENNSLLELSKYTYGKRRMGCRSMYSM